MIGLIARRILRAVPVLLLVSFGTVLLLDLVPGTPAASLLGPDASPQAIADLNQQLGYQDSLPQRYGRWLGHVFTGDFGKSIRTHEPVLDSIKDRLSVTLELAVLALIMALLMGIPAAMYAAYRAGGRFDRVATGLASAFISSPVFLTALVLVYWLSVKAGWFPVTGWARLDDGVPKNLRHAFLPALSLALGEASVFMRLLRSDLINTLQEEFILFARSTGLPTRRILFRYALRPSSFSLVTIAGLAFSRLIGGAVIVEILFALPGLGQLLVQAIFSKDYAIVQGVVMFIAIVFVTFNVITDIAYGYLDPRTRAN
jgi:peptide/nickel transport system permease protein